MRVFIALRVYLVLTQLLECMHQFCQSHQNHYFPLINKISGISRFARITTTPIFS